MGFQEIIGQLMSKLFNSSSVVNDCNHNTTLEDIEALEKQGCDTTEMRATYNLRIKKEAEELQARLDMLAYDKLDEYMTVPRSIETEFVKEVAYINKLSDKDVTRLADAPLVYGTIVQAHSALYERGSGENMGIVFVFAMDSVHVHDQEWLKATADKVVEIKNRKDLPDDCKKFVKKLRDDRSMFCFPLPQSLNEGGADAWCASYTLDKQITLPKGCLPASRVVPFLITDTPEYNRFAQLQLIPSRFYTK